MAPLRSLEELGGDVTRGAIRLVMPHSGRQPEPVVHRFVKNRVTWRRESSDLERAYGNPADVRIAIPLPVNRAYRNSGRNGNGYDSRCQLRARIFGGRLRGEPVLSDTSLPSGRLCLVGADMPCSGTDQRAPGHPWRQRGATRSDIAHFVS